MLCMKARGAVIGMQAGEGCRLIMTSYDLGANSFVQKPVDFAQFTEAATRLGRYRRVLNVPPPGA